MKKIRRFSFTAVAMGLLLVAAAAPAQPAPATAPGESKFMRYVPQPDGGAHLETSIVTYQNADGASVDLVAAVHVADAKFYEELNQQFKKYDSLLYELVSPKGYRPTTHPAARGYQVSEMGFVGMMQRFLTDTLKLSFQLDAIDYGAPNFVHADMDLEVFEARQEARGESMLTLMIQAMVNGMANDDPAFAEAQPGILDLIAAIQSPNRSTHLKLILAKQFGQIDEMMAGFGGSDGSVIVDERNRAAIAVLKEQLAKGEKKLAIFYGAAHLKGMEKILTTEMGFHQVGDPKWLVAWDVPAPPPEPAAATMPAGK